MSEVYTQKETRYLSENTYPSPLKLCPVKWHKDMSRQAPN